MNNNPTSNEEREASSAEDEGREWEAKEKKMEEK